MQYFKVTIYHRNTWFQESYHNILTSNALILSGTVGRTAQEDLCVLEHPTKTIIRGIAGTTKQWIPAIPGAGALWGRAP